MKAIILAAGLGRRLNDLTREKPKCLLEFKGKTILEYQLNALMENNIRDVVIVLGYKGFMIKQFIQNHPVFSRLNIVYVENPLYAESNSSYSWWLAKDYIQDEEELIHLNSDLIFFPELIRHILNKKEKNVVYIDKGIRLNDSMEQVILDKDNKMLHMDKKNTPGAQGKAVGVAKFSKESIRFMLEKIKNYLNEGNKNQHFYGMIRKAILEFDFYGLDLSNSFFREVNTIEDYNAAKDLVSQNRIIPDKTSIIMFYGYPATGKTTASRKIRDCFETELETTLLSTFRIREELKLLDLYSSGQREKVYFEILFRLENELKENIAKFIILDGNFNKKQRRENVYRLSKKYGAEVYIVRCSVKDITEIKRRLEDRKRHIGVLEHKASTFDLYEMIKKTTDPLENDFFLGELPIIIDYISDSCERRINKDLEQLPEMSKFIVNMIIDSLK